LGESRLIDARLDPDPAERESRLAREHRVSADDEHSGRGDRDPRGADRDPAGGRPTERASVRPLARPGSTQSGALTFPTRDNLALAPQPQVRERAATGDDSSHRYQIITLHPTTYPEARTIGEHFRDGYPVIMNLTDMAEPDAKRLVDFAAGLAFGLRGSMERVTNRVFLLSPPNIQVSAEDKAKIAEGGFFDQG
ncbi:MAG TPA: cell division protein SepF, partial [Micromonosporaceae bacterium]